MSASAKRRKAQVLRHARLSDIPDEFSRQAVNASGSFQGNCLFPRMACSPPQFGVSSSIPSVFPGMMPVAQSPVAMSPDDGCKYVFKNHFERTTPHRYPEIVVNGQLADVNGVVRSIVLERDPAPPIFTEGGQPSIVCPLSRVPITCPGRGVNCRHSACFDLRQFLLLSVPGDASVCPICNQHLPFEELRFDPQFFSPKQAPDFRPETPGKDDSLDNILW